MTSWRPIVFLTCCIGAGLTQGDHFASSAAVLPILASLLAAEIDRESGRMAVTLVRAASRLLPADRRDEECEEWLDHVLAAGEHGLLPLTRALSITIVGVPLLAIGLRIGRTGARVRD
jgi:hypothetical protein